jgi:hypothetical protein
MIQLDSKPDNNVKSSKNQCRSLPDKMLNGDAYLFACTMPQLPNTFSHISGEYISWRADTREILGLAFALASFEHCS